MPILIACPTCSHNIQVPDGLAGKLAICPQCRAAFMVPLIGSGSAAAEPTAPSPQTAIVPPLPTQGPPTPPQTAVVPPLPPQGPSTPPQPTVVPVLPPSHAAGSTACPFCAQKIPVTARRCLHCGRTLDFAQRLGETVGVPRDDQDSQTPVELMWPHLWNPAAAALWSLLFTPALGAYLHAANWRTLGMPERAAANMLWVWVTIALLIVNFFTLLVPKSFVIEIIISLAGIALLVGWYFTQGHQQVQYVRERLQNRYSKRTWGLPLLAGVGGLGGYVALCIFVDVVFHKPDPEELAAQVKPLILREWQKNPLMAEATIRDIVLVHKGGNTYTGYVDAAIRGQRVRLRLEVVYDRGNIVWQTKL